MADESPDGTQSTGDALRTLAARVPWFDAAAALIIVFVWGFTITNLDGLKEPIQVLIILVLLIVTIFFGRMMRDRFKALAGSSTDQRGERVLDRVAPHAPDPIEYRKALVEIERKTSRDKEP